MISLHNHGDRWAHRGDDDVQHLGWIMFGLIVGALAKLVMPGRDPGGIIVTIVLGIVGAAARRLARAGDRAVRPRTRPRALSWR